MKPRKPRLGTRGLVQTQRRRFDASQNESTFHGIQGSEMSTRSGAFGLRMARCAAACAIAACGSAWTAQEGLSTSGIPYLTGGVSEEEATALLSRRGAYSLWIVAAARGSGAYLSDVWIRITDANGGTVFDGQTDGPWLMVNLPLGRYVVETRLGSQTLRRTTTIHPGDHHQAVFHFDVDVDVRPPEERRSRHEAPAPGPR